MVNQKLTDRQERLGKFFQAVEEAQKFQDDLLKYGLEAVDLYVEDIDGDWLEKWGENEPHLGQFSSAPGLLSSVVLDFTTFLKSDDVIAVKVRQHLGNQSISEVAMELENCLSLFEEDDKLLAVKRVLASKSAGGVTAGDEKLQLLGLAADLLDKLLEILANQI